MTAPTSHTLDVPGAQLYYELRGSGPLIALVGAPMHSAAFAPLADLLATDHTVFTLDPRGVQHTCLDAVAGRGRRALPVDLGPASERTVVGDRPRTDVEWLGPYPTQLPQARYEQHEAVELAFVAALQHLPGNQRAALLLFDVLDFSAAEIATMMATTTASVTSALQRARVTVEQRVAPRGAAPNVDDTRIRGLVADFASAMERGDAEAMLALLTADVTWSMPPLPAWYRGVGAVMDFVVRVPMTGCGSWRHLPTTANGQPAVAFYLRDGSATGHTAWSINVLTLDGDRIGEVTSFVGAEHFAAFGLPVAWESGQSRTAVASTSTSTSGSNR